MIEDFYNTTLVISCIFSIERIDFDCAFLVLLCYISKMFHGVKNTLFVSVHTTILTRDLVCHEKIYFRCCSHDISSFQLSKGSLLLVL